ncbi:MAG: 5'-methylthioadenosine/adenosylhomocysteine nucleosidase [Lachnospiraceae bacterium]|nr:5'-methylthioadenosine/adenosylhomocysteine nucleosidase [Lachnospiraceae bacterium]
MKGIICAMDLEMKKIREDMKNVKEEKCAGLTFVCGTIDDTEVVAAVCGVGKVNAAICTQAMIDRFSPDCILNVGVAGSLSKELNITDIVIAGMLVQHDFDCTSLGCRPGEIYGSGQKFFIAAPSVVLNLRKAIDIINDRRENAGEKTLHSVEGIIASGDQFISSAEKKSFITSEFDALACEMEGAAIAQVCVANGVKFGVIRAISDSADESSHMDFGEFCRKAADNSAEVVKVFLSESSES